jgi:alpha-beta hydrolase superfamily lysophospholipase
LSTVLAGVQENHGFFEGVGDVRLYYRTFEVVVPRAAFLVVHGMGEHGGRYAEFAHSMAGFGYASFVLDQRGHGNSEGRRGHATRFDALLQDVDRFRREVSGLIDLDCPVFLLGHSLGGLVALRYLEEYDSPLSGGVIVSPWLATALPVPAWKVSLSRIVGRIAPAMPFSLNVPAEYLSHDPAVVTGYRDDLLVHDTITPRMFQEISSAMEAVLQRSDRLAGPLLFLLAGDDRIADTTRSLTLAQSLSAADVTVRVYANYYHEVLNEVDRRSVYLELRDWIETRVES